MKFLAVYLTALLLLVGCNRERGVYFDHVKDEVRVDGTVISEEEFSNLLVNKTRADLPLTVIFEDENIKNTTLGEFQEGPEGGNLFELFLSMDENVSPETGNEVQQDARVE